METFSIAIDDTEKVYFHFQKDEDGYDAIFRLNGTKHCLSVSESMPVGSINCFLDDIGAGCWASITFKTTDITKRDLVWICHWALAAAKHKQAELSLRAKGE